MFEVSIACMPVDFAGQGKTLLISGIISVLVSKYLGKGTMHGQGKTLLTSGIISVLVSK